MGETGVCFRWKTLWKLGRGRNGFDWLELRVREGERDTDQDEKTRAWGGDCEYPFRSLGLFCEWESMRFLAEKSPNP